MATPGVDRLRNTMRNLEANTRSMISDLDGNVLFVKLVAEDLEKENDNQSVMELEQATLDIIKFSHKLSSHCAALETLSRTYQPSAEGTDFKKVIQDHMQELETQSPFDPEKHQFYKQFKEAVWWVEGFWGNEKLSNLVKRDFGVPTMRQKFFIDEGWVNGFYKQKVNHAGEPMPGQEQDEIVMVGTQTLLNTTCPLSGKPVDQLENPVRSQKCRHIYEHDAVVDYIKTHVARNRRQMRPPPCRCAAAGCPKTLIEEELVCDNSLKIEIHEYVLRQQGTLETVADCTNLDEDDDTPLKAWISH